MRGHEKQSLRDYTLVCISQKNKIIIRNWEGLRILWTQRGWDQKRGNPNMLNKTVN